MTEEMTQDNAQEMKSSETQGSLDNSSDNGALAEIMAKKQKIKTLEQ